MGEVFEGLLDVNDPPLSLGHQIEARVPFTTSFFLLDKNGFAAEDLTQVYNKNCINRHVVLFLN